jgi:hypothetical protein
MMIRLRQITQHVNGGIDNRIAWFPETSRIGALFVGQDNRAEHVEIQYRTGEVVTYSVPDMEDE